ncbi:polyketide synthase dehydratase domain-containing protein, partial [Flavivirga jejuensis]|uniref:polyketide synthase dehydratase domain-containing protein n=1 Tax=Flavivirga jejuensis TaxID=870487 RepID=UPI0031E906F9
MAEQKFSSFFTGTEIFLKDHTIKGQHVLPGVAYLEMAREAVMQSADTDIESIQIHLENIVWSRPIVSDQAGVRINISLYSNEKEQIDYEIYSGDNDQILHSQGTAIIKQKEKSDILDLSLIRSKCTKGQLSPDNCYAAFRNVGLEYGPGHQGIKEVYIGDGEVLSKVSLSPLEHDYILHPGIMDSALQASIGLVLGDTNKDEAPTKPMLPFALNEVQIHARCEEVMWVHIKYSEDHAKSEQIQKLDIDLLDESGKICVRMKGYTSRILEEKNENTKNHLLL